MAIAALDDMLNWLRQGGKVAIYDATNSSKERRKLILDRCTGERVQVVFIESLCYDQSIIEKNIRDTKVSNPEYVATLLFLTIELSLSYPLSISCQLHQHAGRKGD